ncbi:MAG: SpoIIE family protein phosphatase [Planctomycetes bacterium]|nr:SpoIIE family protein phosphatase [Planctomycetota bacterium]
MADEEDDKRLAGAPIQIDQTMDAQFVVNQFGETVGYTSTAGSSPSMSRKSDISVPDHIGRYEIRGILGRGAFGAVYRGYDNQLDREVAIKVPLLDAKEAPEENFLGEARQLAQLTHPSIVTVHDVGIENDLCYIVSEYLVGQDLNHWIKGRELSWQDAVGIVVSLLEALDTAHASSTVHRDVKPANIIMTKRGDDFVPVLVDFGLAVSEVTTGTNLGRRGRIAGTPNYMAPEQARGEGHRIDGRTDIYAVGVILYRILSGQLPFKAPSVSDLLEVVIKDEPTPPRQFVRSIPKELERVCLKAMAKQISNRYTTAADMAEDLRSMLKAETNRLASQSVPTKTRDSIATRDVTKILIADDHELSRFKLENDLTKWGHEVTSAEDGEEALELFKSGEFAIVITDWMMPKLDGLELVRKIRETETSDYVYIIMLTAKSEKHDIVAGMGAGADDFLSKPFHRDELHVRLRAGTRITKLNRELNETNRRLQRSQEAAAQIQQSFLPAKKPVVEGYDFAWDQRPTGELGGDMLNVFRLDEKHVGLYVLDVTGDGVPATLLATTLSRVLSPASDPQSILAERDDDTNVRLRTPREVACELNRRFGRQEGKQFFTLLYGVLNIDTGEFSFTSAGHTPLLYQRQGSSPTMVDVSGFPIGMVPDSDDFSEKSLVLESGDRLLISSDGLTDAMRDDGEVYGAARLLESLAQHGSDSIEETTAALMADLDDFRGHVPPSDDSSILGVSMV